MVFVTTAAAIVSETTVKFRLRSKNDIFIPQAFGQSPRMFFVMTNSDSRHSERSFLERKDYHWLQAPSLRLDSVVVAAWFALDCFSRSPQAKERNEHCRNDEYIS